MAITDEEKGVWGVDKVFAKQNQGSIWDYDGKNELWGAGWNNYGQLGTNSINPAPSGGRSSPIQIAGTNWSKVAGTKDGMLATKADGTLWGLGDNDNGLLGQNNEVRYSSPVQVPGTWTDVSSATSPRGGGIKSDGTIWIWGANGHGQMAQNGPNNTGYSSPVQIPGTYAAFEVANFSPLALKTNGSLWSWGRAEKGSIGVPSIAHDNHHSSPVQIPGSWSGAKIAADYNGMAIKTDGTLWIWGTNYYGNLGQNAPDNQNRSSPVQIPGTTWANIDTAYDLCIATKTDGTLWTWGRNNDGALGINKPSNANRSSPIQLPGTTWAAVSTQGSSCCATKTDGTLWTWGMGAGGRLGANSTTYYSSPVQLPGTSWTKEMKQLSTSGGQTYYIKAM